MKRILLGAPPAVCLIYSALLIWSFFGNRELEQGILAAARGIPQAERRGPGIDSLHKLETVRQTLANLTKWSDGAPLRLGFGLYKGNDIRTDVRKIYYAKFQQLLLGSTEEQLLSYLENVPAAPAPNDDYRRSYNALKSYLLMTSESKRTSDAGLQSFLGSDLDARWAGGNKPEIGEERFALAKTQFDYYASDLHNGNPYPAAAKEGPVRKARVYLSKFSKPPSGGEEWVLAPRNAAIE